MGFQYHRAVAMICSSLPCAGPLIPWVTRLANLDLNLAYYSSSVHAIASNSNNVLDLPKLQPLYLERGTQDRGGSRKAWAQHSTCKEPSDPICHTPREMALG